MYRDIKTRGYINNAVSVQQDLIRSWSLPTFDTTESYTRRLREIVKSAIELESYREILRINETKDIQSLLTNAFTYKEILQELPIISKKEYRKISEEVLNVRRKDLLNYFETSGTTDIPMPTPKGLHDFVINTVNFGEHWAEFLNKNDVALILINTPQGPAAFQFEHALNYLGIMTFRTWVDTVRNDYGRVIQVAQSIRPTVFAGPPSQLINLYEYANANNIPGPSFEKVLLTGERSSPALKSRIHNLTRGVVIDASYGSSETGTTAVAISDSILKLQTQSYIFEIVDKDNNTKLITRDCSAEGELIVTALENINRPLIRYKTGDLVRINSQEGNSQYITPLGRVSNTTKFAGVNMDQDQFESLVWAEGENSRIYNYFLAYHGEDIYFIFTGDYESVEQSEQHLGLLKSLIPNIKIRMVPQLPKITGLGSTLGWKISRVHDLRQSKNESYPEHIEQAMQEMHDFILTLDDKVGAYRY